MDYQKIKRIQKLSNLVGCMKKFSPGRIELLLLVVHFVVIILSIMNLLIIPWKKVYKELFGLRIVILTFLLISLLCLIYIQIFRKRKKLSFGYYYCIGFFGSLISTFFLTIIIFLFSLIACITGAIKIKNYKEKKYEYKSMLVIDIFSLIVLVAQFFLWYSEFLLIYAKADKNLKEHIEDKIKFYQSQNQKVVNVEISDDNNTNTNNKNNIDNNLGKEKEKTVDDDVISTNKIDINEKGYTKKNSKKKEDDVSSVDTK
jgi:hypothetical protein